MHRNHHFYLPCAGHGTGDPHYRTFDNTNYDFQGNGDYTLMEIPGPSGTTGPLVTILGRLAQPSSFGGGTTGHVGLALGDSDAAIYVSRLNYLHYICSKKMSALKLRLYVVYLCISLYWAHIKIISHSLEKGANSECFRQGQCKQRSQTVYQLNRWRLRIECQSEETEICLRCVITLVVSE